VGRGGEVPGVKSSELWQEVNDSQLFRSARLTPRRKLLNNEAKGEWCFHSSPHLRSCEALARTPNASPRSFRPHSDCTEFGGKPSIPLFSRYSLDLIW